MTNRCLVIILLVCGLLGCSDAPEKPEHLISEQKYIDILIEKQLLRTLNKYARTDSVEADSLRKAISKKYDITDKQFMDSHAYYQQFTEEQEKRIDKAIDKLKEQLRLRKTTPDSMVTDSTTKDKG